MPMAVKKSGTYVRTEAHRAAAAERARKQIAGWKDSGHPFWKGDSAGYAAKHEWVNGRWGRPKLCDHCGKTDCRQYDWANVSGEHKRERDDWLRLCRSCHFRFDFRRKPRPSWVEFRGERKSLKEWAEIYGINYQRVYQRVRRLGWTIEQALT